MGCAKEFKEKCQGFGARIGTDSGTSGGAAAQVLAVCKTLLGQLFLDRPTDFKRALCSSVAFLRKAFFFWAMALHRAEDSAFCGALACSRKSCSNSCLSLFLAGSSGKSPLENLVPRIFQAGGLQNRGLLPFLPIGFKRFPKHKRRREPKEVATLFY